MYQLNNEAVLFEWLEHEPDPEQRQIMIEWMANLCEDPLRGARRVPGVKAPVYMAVAPVRRLTLRYLVAEQFHTVNLIEFEPLP